MTVALTADMRFLTLVEEMGSMLRVFGKWGHRCPPPRAYAPLTEAMKIRTPTMRELTEFVQAGNKI
jgi:hypothetical protein